MGTPYIVSDVGGMSELVDLERYPEAVVPKGDSAELAVALQAVLERGTLPVLPLRPEVSAQGVLSLCCPSRHACTSQISRN